MLAAIATAHTIAAPARDDATADVARDGGGGLVLDRLFGGSFGDFCSRISAGLNRK
jgi:hypothetical protein